MKKFLIGAALLAAATAAPAFAETRVSINIGDPGFFGMIDNRGYAPPPVYVRQPVIIERVRYHQEPVYVRAPLKHRQHWRQWCHRYDACGVPVLFVRDDWYSDTYAPRVRKVYRDRPRPVVERVVYRDAPRPYVVQKVVYRDRNDRRDHDGRRDRDDRGHGKAKHHDKHHDKGHGNGRGHGNHRD